MPKISKESSKRTRAGDVKRLQFLADFLAARDITYEEGSRRLGIGHPSLWRAVVKVDDTRLDYIYRLVESENYTIMFALAREGDIDNSPVEYDGRELDYSANGSVRIRHTAFITAALRRYGIGLYELAGKLNLQYTSLRNWFSSDDIFWSRVVDIARVCDFNIIVTITKPNYDRLATTGKLRLITRQTSEIVQVFDDPGNKDNGDK